MRMNNYIGQGRKRNQTLLVVEGNHEKNKLFWLILQFFAGKRHGGLGEITLSKMHIFT